ncbi:related to COPII coated vesicle component SEC24 [Rhynchosporium agropyri]|uniref:Related to COPII coated vesicle component SEC24 n=1 Tax=Rhynchosporium agropyri TaxID=914238 RepID=A0A1E1LSA5_9HELO|nr:related to COPII coated vesicle component SEC24 [Rhynchosporium agropyri]
MSEYQYGQGTPYQDPNDPNRSGQLGSPFQPPIAPSPYQQTQQPDVGFSNPTLTPYNNAPPGHTPYAIPQAQGQGQGYFPDKGAQAQDGGLAAQMGGLGLGEVSTHGRKKKKDRHAHHIMEPSGSSAAFNGTPQGEFAPTQYLNAYPSVMPGQQARQFSNTPVTPQMSQFPAPANGPFHPANLATSTEFASRNGGVDPGFAANMQASAQGRVDPDQIPSVPRSRDAIAQYYLNNVYPTFEHHIPPPASVSFVAFDQGNASPKFTRLTMNSIPSAADALQSTGLPLGLLLQPLAPLQPGELEIPVLDFGNIGPPRCHRCRAYINPFMVFRDGGNKFVCNMCNYANDVPPEYFSAITPQGARLDREQRPELMRGTVEFLVPKEYWSKQPVGLRLLFLIDVGQEAFNKGFLEAFCEGVMAALYGDESQNADGVPARRTPEGAKVGFVTFDKDIHFYNMNPALDQAQMLIMPDIEDPFLPLEEGLFVDPYEAKSNITSLLTQLPALFSQIKNPEPALLPTLNAALAALEKTGGKIICSLAALPTYGPGRLFLRDDGKQHGGDAEKKLLNTEHPGWRKAAEKMVATGVGADFFMAAPGGGYLDIATIGHVSASTGGETFYYPNFVSPRDTEKLSQEIIHTVTRETGYQALMKVRCSNGLQVSGYHGNFLQHTFNSDVEFGVVDSDKAIGVMFSYDGKLDSKLDAHFQSALLYTTANGERRVRCSNVIASVSDNAKDCMKFVDQDAVYTLIAKEAASKMITASLKDIRGALTEKNVDILAGYRKNFSGSHPPGQLVLPENLKEFSMYILGLVKSRAFKGGSEPTDRRVHDMRMIKSMGALELSLYLYPRMIPIHNLAPEDGFPNPEGHLVMPPSIRCSFSRVEEGGVYLVDNGQNCYLWLHAQTSPNLLVDLFGPEKDSLKTLDPYSSSLPVLETHLSAQVRNILEYLKTMRGSKALTIQLARQGLDGAEYEFARLLVEDRNNEAQSYVDWLVHIHRHVQLELTGQRKKDDGGGDNSIASQFAGLRPPYW